MLKLLSRRFDAVGSEASLPRHGNLSVYMNGNENIPLNFYLLQTASEGDVVCILFNKLLTSSSAGATEGLHNCWATWVQMLFLYNWNPTTSVRNSSSTTESLQQIEGGGRREKRVRERSERDQKEGERDKKKQTGVHGGRGMTIDDGKRGRKEEGWVVMGGWGGNPEVIHLSGGWKMKEGWKEKWGSCLGREESCHAIRQQRLKQSLKLPFRWWNQMSCFNLQNRQLNSDCSGV